MNGNMCFLCISLILLVLLATYQSLATALWICWHCNGGNIKFPVNNRLLDSQQAFDFHLKYLHGPKKLRIRMNEYYPSTCPHTSGSFAFMLNIVSGWSDSSMELLYRVCSHTLQHWGVLYRLLLIYLQWSVRGSGQSVCTVCCVRCCYPCLSHPQSSHKHGGNSISNHILFIQAARWISDSKRVHFSCN